jgi:aryl-alcohol dehydrogenase-like predicted oxidoreductase
MERRRLGSSHLNVSRLALGSWRTFERIPKEQGVAVMRRAREQGINFLDDARYDDETGTAPIPTGYSEILFGELFREAGWDRDDTVVCNKLWWEFWPGENAMQEIDGSLGRMRFDYIDVIYANPPSEGLAIDELVRQVGELITAGKARAWAMVNWEAEPFLEASKAAHEQGVQQPCAAQLPYSLVRTDWVESPEMTKALEASGAGVVASYSLLGGVLTGKYDAGESGRWRDELEGPALAPALEIGRRVRELAADTGRSPAALAIAFALANPRVASVLFGATRPEQIDDDVTALDVDEETAERVKTLG